MTCEGPTSKFHPFCSVPPTAGSAVPCHDPNSHFAMQLRAWLLGVCQAIESPPSHLQVIWWLNNLSCYFNLPVEMFVAFHSILQLNNVPRYHLSPTISNLAANCLREVQVQSSSSGISVSSLAPSWPRQDCLTVFNYKRENKEWTVLHFQVSILNIKL